MYSTFYISYVFLKKGKGTKGKGGNQQNQQSQRPPPKKKRPQGNREPVNEKGYKVTNHNTSLVHVSRV